MKKSTNTKKRENRILNITITTIVISFILFFIARQFIVVSGPIGGEVFFFFLPAIAYFFCKNVVLSKKVSREYKNR